jgi:hypothetical protein
MFSRNLQDIFLEVRIMAQVSDSTASLQEALGSLQNRGPSQNQQAPPEGGDAAENGRSNRLAEQKESNDAQQVRQTEDRILLSREAQEQNREGRVDEGKRNVDNLRPPSEQRTNERGAAQRLNDLNDVNARGVPNNEGGVDRIQSEGNPGSAEAEVNAEKNRTESRVQAESRDQLRKEAADRTNAEVQLREFQNKDEVRIEPKKVSQSVEEINYQRERADAAKETVLETPSQRIIQEEPSGSSQPARSADNKTRSDSSASDRQPPSPASVQTETGQNVDDLI